jgi:glycine/serine hydroxymethyltransferase
LMNRILSEVDPQMAVILDGEMKRQQNCLVMIPSENYASKAVLQTQGCIMTNKYAEGYPGARFYNGCQFMDMAESLAIERAKKLFGAEHVNVQPSTGAQANMAVYYALLNDGDTFLAMDINHGGHLSHGRKQNFSGRYYNPVFYGVEKDTEIIDLNKVLDIAKECKPKLIVVGASAYPRTLDFKAWREIADEVGALYRSYRWWYSSRSCALLRYSNNNDTQNSQRTKRRNNHVPQGVRGEDRQGGISGRSGGTTDAHNRRQSSIFQRGIGIRI